LIVTFFIEEIIFKFILKEIHSHPFFKIQFSTNFQEIGREIQQERNPTLIFKFKSFAILPIRPENEIIRDQQT